MVSDKPSTLTLKNLLSKGNVIKDGFVIKLFYFENFYLLFIILLVLFDQVIKMIEYVFDPVKTPRFHRDFANDFPKGKGKSESESLAQRVLLASLPILSLYRPFGRALSIGANSSRLFFAGKELELSLEKMGNLALSVAAVAGGIFYSSAGMMITTSHDILLNLQGIANSDQKLLEGVKFLNNVAYISLLFYGSLELQIISLATQILLNFGSSVIEYKKGRYIEMGTNLFMTGIRLKQMQNYVELWNRKRKIEEAIRNIFVGRMGEKWQFPSDHLPIGVEIDGEFEVISWNVMNNCYMEWVRTKDSQGLNGSLLTDLDVQVNAKGLTKRDLLIVDMLRTMTDKPKSGLIALQECGEPFLEALEESLPKNWHIARSFDQLTKDQEVVLYNDSYVSFEKDLSETSLDAYPSLKGRQLAQAVFKKVTDGKIMRLFNAHIPGNPALPCPEEYARYVSRFFSKDEAIVALGDCNFERERMIHAFEQARLLDERYPEQVLHTPWPTNVHPYMADFDPGPLNSKGIDHTLVLGATSRTLGMREVLDDDRFAQTIEYLQGKNH